jgi:hypothetical protein
MSNRKDHLSSQGLDSATGRSVASLIRALHTVEQEPLSCAECQAQFAGLYHAHQSGAALAPGEQMAVLHLANCPDCAAEYDVLRSTLTDLETGILPELAEQHVFDLSFLASHAPASQPAAPTLWTKPLARQVWSLVADLQVHLQAAGAAFGLLPAALVPARAAGTVLRTESVGGQAEVLALPAPDADVSVQLTIGSVIAGKAVVVVKLLGIQNGQPLAGTLITLRNGQRQLLAGSMTGLDGTVIFEQLPLGRYFVQVKHEQQIWEVPLVIVAGTSPIAPES